MGIRRRTSSAQGGVFYSARLAHRRALADLAAFAQHAEKMATKSLKVCAHASIYATKACDGLAQALACVMEMIWLAVT